MRRLAIGLLVLLLARPAAADEYHDGTRGFRVELPPGWVVLRDQKLPFAGGLRGDRFLAAFAKEGGGLVFPYVLVLYSADDLEGKSVAELEESLKEQRAKLHRLGMEDIRYDQATGRVVMNFSLAVPGVGGVRGRAIGFLAYDGMITLIFYDREEDFDANVSAHESMVRNFEFSEGREWDPAMSIPKPLLFILFGAGIGGALGLIIWRAKKQDRNRLSTRAARGRGAGREPRPTRGGSTRERPTGGRPTRGRPPRGRRRR